jgi:hypothetical protein
MFYAPLNKRAIIFTEMAYRVIIKVHYHYGRVRELYDAMCNCPNPVPPPWQLLKTTGATKEDRNFLLVIWVQCFAGQLSII